MPRLKRIKSEETAVYHCVSRTVNKEHLWHETAKEVFRKQIWATAAFCGVEVLAYCIMTNHVHLLIRVHPGASAELSSEELQLRLENFYTHPKDAQVLATLLTHLHHEDPQIQASARRRLLARMDDVSQFMKILKQRFSIWFNHQHGRWGTHWGERFKSVLVQDTPPCLRMVAAYIALNPIRAGLCRDPKDYRFSSYAEAVSGKNKAQTGIAQACGVNDLRQAMAQFRQFLFRLGRMKKRDGTGATIDKQRTEKVEAEQGQLSPIDLWQARARFFTDGVAIGSSEYLQQLISRNTLPGSTRTRPQEIDSALTPNLACLRWHKG